ncbi:MAG TPA: hypothetical protein VK203_27610 [Nostocaceae cyanobacterium]|nr:hypothetical protein [Nostocaceae cyanobacterium]
MLPCPIQQYHPPALQSGGFDFICSFVLEQISTTTSLAPEQKFNQWMKEYPVFRGSKKYKYFRYIRGGVRGKLAQDWVERIKQAIANGKTKTHAC